jgi:hypothetical protein
MKKTNKQKIIIFKKLFFRIIRIASIAILIFLAVLVLYNLFNNQLTLDSETRVCGHQPVIIQTSSGFENNDVSYDIFLPGAKDYRYVALMPDPLRWDTIYGYACNEKEAIDLMRPLTEFDIGIESKNGWKYVTRDDPLQTYP